VTNPNSNSLWLTLKMALCKNNRSFCLDIKIVWLTLVKVASREAVIPSDEEIMPKLNKNDIKIN
jgi:hypothetical protein